MELLVSLTILSVILFSLAQAIGFVSKLWISGVGAVDNFSKARDILTVMDRDVQGMVMRPDLPAFIDGSTPPVPACAFYSNIQGNPGAVARDPRTVSLIDYVPNYNSSAFTLYRLNYGNSFVTTNVPTVGSTTLSDLATATSATTNPTGQENIATGVIQFGYQFVDGTGTINTPNPDYSAAQGAAYTISPSPNATASSPQNYAFDYTAPNAPANSRAVIVSLLVLSDSGVRLVNQSTGMATKLTTDFAGTPPLQINQTYGQYWNGILNPATGNFDPTLPPTVRSGLRVFERYIPLPLVTPPS